MTSGHVTGGGLIVASLAVDIALSKGLQQVG